jgi:hypothetical protein
MFPIAKVQDYESRGMLYQTHQSPDWQFGQLGCLEALFDVEFWKPCLLDGCERPY